MEDLKTTVEELKLKVEKIIKDRDWNQFDDPKSLSMCIAVEAAELMEIFTWHPHNDLFARLEAKRTEVEHEVADIAISLLNFCSMAKIDLAKAMQVKLKLLEEKYPVETAKSNPQKYTEY